MRQLSSMILVLSLLWNTQGRTLFSSFPSGRLSRTKTLHLISSSDENHDNLSSALVKAIRLNDKQINPRVRMINNDPTTNNSQLMTAGEPNPKSQDVVPKVSSSTSTNGQLVIYQLSTSFSSSPSPFGLDFGTSDSGLTINHI